MIERGNKNYKIVTLEDMIHLFQECETSNVDEYKELEQTVSPKVLEEISAWILETVRVK